MTTFAACVVVIYLLHRGYVAASGWVERRRDRKVTGRRPR